MIQDTSKLYNADTLLALDIAWCESQFIPTAKNSSSSAEGVYQFIDSTWLHYCSDNLDDKFDAEKNIDCAIKLIAENQEGHWYASQPCWRYNPYTRRHPQK